MAAVGLAPVADGIRRAALRIGVRWAVDQSAVQAGDRRSTAAAAAAARSGAPSSAAGAAPTASAACPDAARGQIGILLLGEPVLREAAHLAGTDAQVPVGIEHRR